MYDVVSCVVFLFVVMCGFFGFCIGVRRCLFFVACSLLLVACCMLFVVVCWL